MILGRITRSERTGNQLDGNIISVVIGVVIFKQPRFPSPLPTTCWQGRSCDLQCCKICQCGVGLPVARHKLCCHCWVELPCCQCCHVANVAILPMLPMLPCCQCCQLRQKEICSESCRQFFKSWMDDGSWDSTNPSYKKRGWAKKEENSWYL